MRALRTTAPLCRSWPTTITLRLKSTRDGIEFRLKLGGNTLRKLRVGLHWPVISSQ
jgi:hypothetical protein